MVTRPAHEPHPVPGAPVFPPAVSRSLHSSTRRPARKRETNPTPGPPPTAHNRSPAENQPPAVFAASTPSTVHSAFLSFFYLKNFVPGPRIPGASTFAFCRRGPGTCFTMSYTYHHV